MQLSLALVGLAHLFALSTAAAVPQSATGNGATVFCLAVCEPPGKICADGKVCYTHSPLSSDLRPAIHPAARLPAAIWKEEAGLRKEKVSSLFAYLAHSRMLLLPYKLVEVILTFALCFCKISRPTSPMADQ
jgi:hypothetical protein